MIDVHRVAQRRRNTAYAYEGIVTAYHVARQIGDTQAARKFRLVIEEGLTKLTGWQVGGPIPSPYLRQQADFDPSCAGGVLGADENPWLRIDTTQHQMHAVILARRYVWAAE
jgi:UDP-N-acetylmuramoyl-tripeptide--D-alanyl-D-alanine ligase